MSISKVQFDGNNLINLESDTVTASHLETGYTAHDATGAIITGTLVKGITPAGSINITQNGTYDVTDKASAAVSVSGQAPTLITKSISANGTYNALSDSADGYSQVTVNVPTPTPSYDTPSISVSSAGVVTATANGKSNTHTLSSSDDADFIAANIKEGVTLFGVLGTLSGGGGGLPWTAADITSFTGGGVVSEAVMQTNPLSVKPNMILIYKDGDASGISANARGILAATIYINNHNDTVIGGNGITWGSSPSQSSSYVAGTVLTEMSYNSSTGVLSFSSPTNREFVSGATYKCIWIKL